jgi:predicted methyltransferase
MRSSVMRTTLFLVLASLTGCAGGRAPQDASDATLVSARAYTVTNTHVVREATPTPRILDLLAAPDRAPEDRALDEPRQAADLLTFLAPEPDMRIAELGCGRGYLTELLARVVGPHGVVYGQNAPAMLAGSPVASEWRSRLLRPSNANVVRVDRTFVDPLPQGTRALDLVFLAIDYGQLAPFGIDRDAMNHAVHLALRPGGRYVVLDETPREGKLLTDLRALHAEESRNARREIESAGFVFASEGRFFRDSSDPRDWDASPRGPRPGDPRVGDPRVGDSRVGEKRDRFVLAFVKP